MIRWSELHQEVDESTYASVKKPTPATRQTLKWNQLEGTSGNACAGDTEGNTHENLALSTSARAALRFSSRA